MHSYTKSGYDINIYQDEYAPSPREDDTLGIMQLHWGSYNLADTDCLLTKQEVKSLSGWDEVEKELIKRGAKHIIRVRAYEHSGLFLSTSNSYPFDCPWDSGCCGFIYTTDEKIKTFGTKKKHIEEVLLAELETYGSYLRGEVYSYTIYDLNDEVVDGCGGYFSIEECEKAAEDFVDTLITNESPIIQLQGV